MALGRRRNSRAWPAADLRLSFRERLCSASVSAVGVGGVVCGSMRRMRAP